MKQEGYVARRVGCSLLLTSKPRVLRRLKDGSRLIRIPVREQHRRQHILQWLELREIRVRVGRKGHRPSDLRLWTTLRDPRTAPGLELAQVYARRWGHEWYFRELKRQLRKSALLQSHRSTQRRRKSRPWSSPARWSSRCG